jgi:hypothetical protein
LVTRYQEAAAIDSQPNEFVNYAKLISLDVPRTFTTFDVVQYKYNNSTGHYSQRDPDTFSVSTYHIELIQVLEAFALFRPAIGYVKKYFSCFFLM